MMDGHVSEGHEQKTLLGHSRHITVMKHIEKIRIRNVLRENTKTHTKHVKPPLDNDAGRSRSGWGKTAAGAHPRPGEGLPVPDVGVDGTGTTGGAGSDGIGRGRGSIATTAVV